MWKNHLLDSTHVSIVHSFAFTLLVSICLLEVLFCVLSVEFVYPWLAALLRVKITIVMALVCSRRTCHNVTNFFWCRMSVHDLPDC